MKRWRRFKASLRYEACLGSRRSRPGCYKSEFPGRKNVSASQLERGHKGMLQRQIEWIIDERILLRASVLFVNFVAGK
jgi:hypothetical protein